MANAMTAVGLGLAAASFTGRYILHRFPSISVQTTSLFKTLSSWESILNSNKFYKGGFDPKMSKREASLILGVSQNASKPTIKQAHKRLITINHPDRGGSPFIAAKVNEAKDCLQNSK